MVDRQPIKLCASLVSRNELNRYLPLVLDNLLGFCDSIIVLDDASDDGTYEFLMAHEGVTRIMQPANGQPGFYQHEGRTRQALLDLTLAERPTHVLNVDCDELVEDGARLRQTLTAQPEVAVWSLIIEEVWNVSHRALQIREDGGWRSHPLNVLWRVPWENNDLRIMDRRLACRRVPTAIWQQSGRPTGTGLLHFGWADPRERQARYDRYRKHDQGRYHASSHLRSIMLPERQMRFRRRGWPEGAEFDAIRDRLAGPVGSRA